MAQPEEKKVTLRPREALDNQRKGEILRAMRDAAEIKQPVETEWVYELAGLIGLDIRKR
jgi:hypothetical protein